MAKGVTKGGSSKRKKGKTLDALARQVSKDENGDTDSVRKKDGNPLGLTVGDKVYVKPSIEGEDSYVAQIVAFERGGRVKLRWYYKPQDSLSGRQSWHGERELFNSPATDWNHIGCIEGKCYVHSLEEYESLVTVGPADFYCRFTYDPTTGRFRPDVVPVYCSCELPYNPDRDMVLCEKCMEWYHCDCAGFNKNKNTKAAFICKRCESRPKKK